MTRDFIKKNNAKAEACRLAGLKENILKDIKSAETMIVGGIFGNVKEAEVYRFNNCDGKEVLIGITEAGGDDVFHKGREGYHLWLILEESGMSQRV